MRRGESGETAHGMETETTVTVVSAEETDFSETFQRREDQNLKTAKSTLYIDPTRAGKVKYVVQLA